MGNCIMLIVLNPVVIDNGTRFFLWDYSVGFCGTEAFGSVVELNILSFPKTSIFSVAELVLLRSRICPDKTSISQFVGSCFSAQNAILHTQWRPSPCSSWLSCPGSIIFWGVRDTCMICGHGTLVFPFWTVWSQGGNVGMGWSGKERTKSRGRGAKGPTTMVLAWVRPLKATQRSSWGNCRALSGWYCPSVLCSL